MLLCLQMTAYARQPGRLVCDNWPPYEFEDGDTVQGFSTDVVRAVYKDMGVPIESITVLPWKRALTDLEQGKADALFSANDSPIRRRFAHFPTEPLAVSPWIVWSRKGDVPPTMDALKGRRVGVVIGFNYTPEFWDFITLYCHVQQVATDESNFLKLAQNRIDFTVAELHNGMYLLNKLALTGILPRPNLEIMRNGVYLIFNRKLVDQTFVKSFSDRLRIFKTGAAYRKLRLKYFGTEAQANELVP
ncbi:substrate-binding periplasmic protein [Pseudodesulfovibrio cashew]|nr:transporter substrate-binding domain-containing protein [Pseudodesulfovibrio cashew]